VPKVRLIDSEGQQVGIVTTLDALEKARQVSLDLVEISPNVDPPVCRIMDYGKYQFELSKKRSSSKKKQKQVQIKEIKFRPVTDIGDFNVKVTKILAFLERGDKVKVSIRFRGREMQHKDQGMDVFNRIRELLPEGHVIEQMPRLEGKQMSMTVAVGKKK
jgi:translation initiation factor IF-3